MVFRNSKSLDANTARQICLDAVLKYGAEHQLKKVVEELGELLTEIGRLGTDRADLEALADELADAVIVLEQVALICGVGGRACTRIDYKLTRLAARVHQSKEGPDGKH